MAKTTGKTANSFPATLDRVVRDRERVIVIRHGKKVAALVPLRDLAALEELEDRLDVEDAERILAESKAKREKPIPWEKAKKKLGL